MPGTISRARSSSRSSPRPSSSLLLVGWEEVGLVWVGQFLFAPINIEDGPVCKRLFKQLVENGLNFVLIIAGFAFPEGIASKLPQASWPIFPVLTHFIEYRCDRLLV